MEMELKTGPRDVFLHLLATITLYATAVSLLTLLFQYINLALPDVLDYAAGAYSTIRLSISTLIIVFPAFVLTSWYLNKMYVAVPERRAWRFRKWLIYFTLFIAALVVIGDLVTLVYNFLQGDMTLRFGVKVLAVLLVSGNIFIYYFWDLRRNKIE